MKRGTQLTRRPTHATRRAEAKVSTARGRARPDAGEGVGIELRPAAWLLVAAEILSLWLRRPPLGKRALVGLAWTFLPRRLKLFAGAAAAVALLLAAGALAVLVVAISQLA
jgi:hypothetical protein